MRDPTKPFKIQVLLVLFSLLLLKILNICSRSPAWRIGKEFVDIIV